MPPVPDIEAMRDELSFTRFERERGEFPVKLKPTVTSP